MPGNQKDHQPEEPHENGSEGDDVGRPAKRTAGQPESLQDEDAGTKTGAVPESPADSPDAGVDPSARGVAAAPSKENEEGTEKQVETDYEDTGRGHRVIRRTTRRRTTTEDIQEDIEEDYALPAAYPVPGADHPAPVG